MTTLHTVKMDDLKKFKESNKQLGVCERTIPLESRDFFRNMEAYSFGIAGKVHKKSALKDIQNIIENKLPDSVLQHKFCKDWLMDMATLSALFCDIQNSNAICFWVGSQRGCRRFHMDSVPMRLLVTYSGKGTEWLPDEAANLDAYNNKGTNAEIVKDKSALKYLNQWDIAIFRGGSKGLLHRTPDEALNGPSILMRLDDESFWDNVLEKQVM